MVKLTILVLMMSFPFLSLAEFRANIKQNEEMIMPEKAYTFLNHSTADWDDKRLTESTVLRMVDFSKHHHMPSIATVHTDAFLNQFKEASFYFISNQTVDYVMHSDGGHHRLKFPNAKAIMVGGGNLHLCLCESIRDIVNGLMPLKENKQIFIVHEATFDRDFSKLPETENEMSQFVDEYFFPDFACPLQVATDFGPIDTKDVNMKFFFHGKLLKESRPQHEGLAELAIRYEKWPVVQAAMNQIEMKKRNEKTK